MDELRAYKSLEAYNQFVSGWVRDVLTYTTKDLCVCRAQVLHSMRMSEKLLNPWVIVEKTGKVLSAHCDCIAGLGETCTHISALLFKLEAAVMIRDSRTVTQEPAYWLLPKNMGKPVYKRIRDMDFTSVKTKKKMLDCTLDSNVSLPSTSTMHKSPVKKVVPAPTTVEMNNFYSRLYEANEKAPILSVHPDYCDRYEPTPTPDRYPQLLSELVDVSTFDKNYVKLLEVCNKLTITAYVI